MVIENKQDSVGIVKPQSIDIKKPLKLKNGGELPSWTLVYETYGKLNPQRNNAILICHALSGNHHAAGRHSEEDKKPGWWDDLIGPGKAVDTNKFYVVSPNNIGGCHGSSGPASINPATQKPYGAAFPQVVVEDWVASQVMLSDHLGIDCWAAVMGGSLGGMQAIQWAISQPHRLKSALLIAATSQLHSQNIAFNEIARQAILKDPNFHKGDYLLHDTKPTQGLWLARMLGHITYLSEEAMLKKFGRSVGASNSNITDDKPNAAGSITDSSMKFEVENYLNYQGEKFAESFDANTYLLMTRALDYFDPASEYGGDLSQAISRTDCSFLVVSFSSDWRFSSASSRNMVDAIIKAGKRVAYSEIESNQGHDSFLMPIPRYSDAVGKFLSNIGKELEI
ncbi:MAG: homoserine O-acetyltransferase [Gammaproteobacteria bacterium]|nr:homoserine O-acetyltransferase [Gammaproteobacteria bacterium]